MTSPTPRRSEIAPGTAAIVAGAGETLVLVHGVGLRAEAWMPQITSLCEARRVVAVDMPGHGLSARLVAGSDLPAFVGWLAEAVESLGVGPVDLAGHSMGALVAAGLAIERPDLVRRLAVLNGVYRRTEAAREAVVARAAEIAAGRPDVRGPLERWFPHPQEADLRTLVGGWLAEVDLSGYAAAYGAFAGGDTVYADRWSSIRCPVLALTGAEDHNSTGAMAMAMAAAARHGTVAVIPGHRHMVNLTAPELVTSHLRDWLAEPLATAEART